MSDKYREQILKQKLLSDIYKKERARGGDIDLKSDEQEKQKSLIKRLEKKPVRLEGESDEDYQMRLDQWEARVGIKLKEDFIKEKDKLLKNFQRLMSPAEAGELMASSQITEDNIIKLNRHWDSFEKALRKKYTSLDFDILEEFISKYIETVDEDNDLSALSRNIKEVDENLKRGLLIIRDRLDDITISLDDKIQELRLLLNTVNNKNNANLFKVYNLLNDLITNKTNYTIEQIEAKTTDIMNNINEARITTDVATREVLDSIQTSLETVQDGIFRSEKKIINKIVSSNENINTNLSDTRDLLRFDIENQIDRSVNNQARILSTITKSQPTSSRESDDLNSISKRQKELEKELELSRNEDQDQDQKYEPDMKESPSPLKSNRSNLYTTEEVINQFKANVSLYDNVRGKLNDKRIKNDMLSRAEAYSDTIPQGAAFLRQFKNKIYNETNILKISNSDIENYVIPLIAFERNYYLIGNTRIKAKNRSNNNAVTFAKNLFGAGNTVLSTISPNKIIIGTGLDYEDNNFITFGRYKINADSLDEKNLLVTYHNSSKNRVKYFPQKIVSDDFKELIYYVSSKNKYNDKLFNLLDDSERLLFKNLFIKSGLSKMLNVKIFDNETKQAKKDYEDLKEQYYIIDGQINAGNDNPLLIKQLNDITKQLKKQIVYMHKINMLGLKEANNLILSL